MFLNLAAIFYLKAAHILHLSFNLVDEFGTQKFLSENLKLS